MAPMPKLAEQTATIFFLRRSTPDDPFIVRLSSDGKLAHHGCYLPRKRFCRRINTPTLSPQLRRVQVQNHPNKICAAMLSIVRFLNQC